MPGGRPGSPLRRPDGRRPDAPRGDPARARRRAGVLIAVRTIDGGSVSLEGAALSGLARVWVDPAARIARAQPGCRLGDVDRETQVHGLAAVLGFISDTGIAGLTLGGGFGWLTRRFGFTCDTLVSLEVVTANGRVVRAADDENPFHGGSVRRVRLVTRAARILRNAR